MTNPYRHVFDESSRQQSERTKAGANVRLGETEIMELKDRREEAAKARAFEKKDALLKLKDLIRQNPGIGQEEILKLGGYPKFPEKELKLLKQMKVIEWRNRGYFIHQAQAE
jgi:hypothetical protein